MYQFVSRLLVMLLLFGIISSLAPHVALAQETAPTQSQAEQYLNKMIAAYKGIKSYSGSFKLSGEVLGQPKLPAPRGTVSLQMPNRAALKVTEGAHADHAVFDGKNLLVTSSRHNNQYIKQPLSRGLGIMRVLTRGSMTGPGLSVLFTQPDALKFSAPPKSLSLGQPTTVAGVPVVTVISKTEQGPNTLTLTYLIGKNDSLLYQMTLVQTAGPQNITLTETHTNVKINPKLPASTFTFTPPRGAKPVKQFPRTR